MKRHWWIISKLREKRGATAAIVAIAITTLLGFAALSVDLGNVMVTKNELQNVADAAALAAAGKLGNLYSNMTLAEQKTYVCDPSVIINTANTVAQQNKAAGASISINSSDVVIGTWDSKTKILTPTNAQPDAVRVTARRDGSANSPITTFFASVLGTNTIAVSAVATAALTSQNTIESGKLIPIGISEYWFTANLCGQPIKMNPSNDPDSCGGWNTYTMSPSNDNTLRKDILEPWEKNTFSPPGATKGIDFSFTGGNLSNQTFDAFLNLFNKMKLIDGDGDDNAWTASVVVYKVENISKPCENPNGTRTILGFAKAKIKSVNVSTKTIFADIVCGYVDPGRGGGGGEYGTKGSIPGLVQ